MLIFSTIFSSIYKLKIVHHHLFYYGNIQSCGTFFQRSRIQQYFWFAEAPFVKQIFHQLGTIELSDDSNIIYNIGKSIFDYRIHCMHIFIIFMVDKIFNTNKQFIIASLNGNLIFMH